MTRQELEANINSLKKDLPMLQRAIADTTANLHQQVGSIRALEYVLTNTPEEEAPKPDSTGDNTE